MKSGSHNRVLLQWCVALALSAAVGGVSAADVTVGDPAPNFTLEGTDGKTYNLADFKGKQTVILAWYPKAYTSGCTIECKSLAEHGDLIKAYDVTYFMASVDPLDKNKAFAQQENANFPMLSDEDKKVADAYGVLNPASGTARRWWFFIGPDGKILHIETASHTADAGQFLAAKLEELKVKKK